MMFPVVDQPEGKLLDALLRVVQIGKLPLQCRLRVAHLSKVESKVQDQRNLINKFQDKQTLLLLLKIFLSFCCGYENR
jgi:hypothetical protein